MHGLYQIMYFTLIDILNTLLSPFFIVIFAIIYYQYYQISKQSPNLSISNKPIILKTLNSTFYGIVGGFITTIAFIYLEVKVNPIDFIYILIIAIILSIINPRFMCFAYAGSLVSLFSTLLGFPNVESREIMIITATLHIVESLLVLINGSKEHQPTLVDFNGDDVALFNMNRFWPIPFVVFIGNDLIKPITLMAILNYGDYTFSYPKRKTIFTGLLMAIYSTTLLLITRACENLLIPPLFAILGHEFIVHLNIWIERNRTPIFKPALKGVRVIQVCNNTIAKEIGIKVGDIILNINGMDINVEKDIQYIERLYNDSYRIRLFSNRKGIITKVYKGKRKALGVGVIPKALN